MSSFERFRAVDSTAEAIVRREFDGLAEVFRRTNAIDEDWGDEEEKKTKGRVGV